MTVLTRTHKFRAPGVTLIMTRRPALQDSLSFRVPGPPPADSEGGAHTIPSCRDRDLGALQAPQRAAATVTVTAAHTVPGRAGAPGRPMMIMMMSGRGRH